MLTMTLGTSRVLPVPYLAQPTDTTCQATVLKMMAKGEIAMPDGDAVDDLTV